MEDIRYHEADVLVCLGDVVGYGPKPLEVLHAIRSVTPNFVIGNHDAAAAGLLDASYFNDQARAVIQWTQSRLDQEAIQFFARTPLTMETESLCFVYAERVEPARFGYIDDAAEAWQNLMSFPNHRFIFVGHTHHPTAFIEQGGQVHVAEDEDFTLAPGQRALVNVGSVGEPRNPDDLRARYVLFDADVGAVFFRAVEFDVEAYRADLVESGLGIEPYFLRAHDHNVAEQFEAEVRAMMDNVRIPKVSRRAFFSEPKKLHVPEDAAPTGPRRQLLTPPPEVTADDWEGDFEEFEEAVEEELETKKPAKRSKASAFFLVLLGLIAALAAGWWLMQPEGWLESPDGGQQLLKKNEPDKLFSIGGRSKKRETIEVEGMPFTHAYHVEVDRDNEEKRHEVQIRLDTDGAVKKGDVIWITLFVRGQTLDAENLPVARANSYFQRNHEPYTKIQKFEIEATPEWRQYAAAFVMREDFDKGKTNFVIHLAFGKQWLEFGGVSIQNFGDKVRVNDLPRRNWNPPKPKSKK